MAKTREVVHIIGNTPFVAPRVQDSDEKPGPLNRCVLDTGCPFCLIVSPELAERIRKESRVYHGQIHHADDTPKETKYFLGRIYWLTDQPKLIDIRVMDPCPDPILGFPLLKETKILLGSETGSVESLSETDLL